MTATTDRIAIEDILGDYGLQASAECLDRLEAQILYARTQTARVVKHSIYHSIEGFVLTCCWIAFFIVVYDGLGRIGIHGW